MDATNMEMAIARSGKTKIYLARSLGLSNTAFWNKINGSIEFKASEIKKLIQELNLSGEEVNLIFFS